MRLRVQANPTYPELSDPRAGWLDFLAGLAAEIGPESELVEVSFVDDAAIRDLNRDYRGKDAPTDVLSFTYGRDAEGFAGAEDDPFGEIVLSVETAGRQAEAGRRGLPEELSVLVIHGIYHILGHDHEFDEEAAAMEALEEPFRLRLANFFAPRTERS